MSAVRPVLNDGSIMSQGVRQHMLPLWWYWIWYPPPALRLCSRISPGPSGTAPWCWRRGVAVTADFRGLELIHNGTHVLDEIPGARKRQCEIFSPLPMSIAGSHCTCLPAALPGLWRLRCGDTLSTRVWLSGLSGGKTPHTKRPHALKNSETDGEACESISHRENRRSNLL